MQSEAPLESILKRGLQWVKLILRMVVRVSISDIVRCTAIDGFLMLNVSNSYEQHSVRMQELEVG